ncbi:hypothetical protein FGB62_11g340 [Gracilaria domingensis]|nr:hypothetical protein FGB62_11g340 [Gracilaria domingensis]
MRAGRRRAHRGAHGGDGAVLRVRRHAGQHAGRAMRRVAVPGVRGAPRRGDGAAAGGGGHGRHCVRPHGLFWHAEGRRARLRRGRRGHELLPDQGAVGVCGRPAATRRAAERHRRFVRTHSPPPRSRRPHLPLPSPPPPPSQTPPPPARRHAPTTVHRRAGAHRAAAHAGHAHAHLLAAAEPPAAALRSVLPHVRARRAGAGAVVPRRRHAARGAVRRVRGVRRRAGAGADAAGARARRAAGRRGGGRARLVAAVCAAARRQDGAAQLDAVRQLDVAGRRRRRRRRLAPRHQLGRVATLRALVTHCICCLLC